MKMIGRILVFAIGGFLVSLIAALLVSGITIPKISVIAALLGIVTLLFAYLKLLKRRQRKIIAKAIYQVVAYIPFVFLLLVISWRG